MNIHKETLDDLNAVVKIEISAEDYEEKVHKVLKDYQRKSNVPGFRPGKVPIGMIKKLYGNAVKLEEINTVLSDTLTNYITEHNLNILGNPLPSLNRSHEINWETQEDFEFYFDIGLTPEISFTLTDELSVEYYLIKVDESLVDKYFTDIRKKYGSHIHTEVSEAGDVLKGNIYELDGDGNEKEGGISNESSISVDFIKDEDIKKDFIDVKQGDKIRFNPFKATGDAAETASMLNISREDAEKLDAVFEFVVNEIIRVQAAELNEEFYSKVYPQDDIHDENAFRERIRKDAQTTFAVESDRLFLSDITRKILETTDLHLPHDFLKRWLFESNKEKMTIAHIEEHYESYARALKWQLIENKIMKDHQIEVTDEDIRNHVKAYFGINMFSQTEGDEQNERINKIVDMVLQNKEESNKITEQLTDKKMLELFRSSVKMEEKEVNYEDFVKLATENRN